VHDMCHGPGRLAIIRLFEPTVVWSVLDRPEAISGLEMIAAGGCGVGRGITISFYIRDFECMQLDAKTVRG